MFGAIVVVIGAIATVLLVMFLTGKMYRLIGPNQALIVYGWGGTQIITGGGKLVIPVFQSSQVLSLELMSFDVAPEQDLYTSQGVAVKVEAVSQLKIKSDPESVRTAAEQLLTKNQDEREGLIRLVMEGHLRGIMGLLTVEQIVKEPEMVAGRFRETVAADLSKMGLEVVSFTIKKVMDEQNYIDNMGLPDVARIKRQAEIAQAEAERDIAIKRAEAQRESAIAQAQADQARVMAQAASETKQAEAMRDLNTKKAEYEAAVNEQKAYAEKAYEIAANQAQQKVMTEQVKIAQVEKQEQTKVQELEVRRRELELEAGYIKQSIAEKQRIELLADAERQRLASEASGRAEAIREQGKAEAEILLAKGSAEADVIRAKGQAEADVMQLRGDAYQHFNEAAIVDRLVGALPQMAASFAESLAKVDKISIVSTGNGHGGVSALTGEVAKMLAQMPEVVETLSGVRLSDMVSRLPGMDGKTHLSRPTQPVVVADPPQETQI